MTFSSSVNEYYKATHGNVQMWMLTQADFTYRDFLKQTKQVLPSDKLYIQMDEGRKQTKRIFSEAINYKCTTAQATTSQKSRYAPNPAVLNSFFSLTGNILKLKKLTQHAL